MASASSSALCVDRVIEGTSQACMVYELSGEDVVDKRIVFRQSAYSIIPDDEMPSRVRALCSGAMHALDTVGDGACALHAVFGKPTASDGLYLANAREFAARLLRPSPDELLRRGAPHFCVDAVKNSLWHEFALPSFRQITSAEIDCFVEAMEETLPALAREVKEMHDARLLADFAWEPAEFASRSWPAYLHCIQKEGYYFSVEEVLVMCSQAHINIAVFTEIGGRLTYQGGHFSGAEPLVCAKLNTNNSGRARGHFERIISSSEVESLTQAAASVPRAPKTEADGNNRRSQGKRTLDPGEMHQPTHSKKSGVLPPHRVA